MNRVDRLVAAVVLAFLGLALLRAALDIAAQLAVLVTFCGVVYAGVRLWKAGKLDFLKPSKTAEHAERQ